VTGIALKTVMLSSASQINPQELNPKTVRAKSYVPMIKTIIGFQIVNEA
jgi:hypothetical protein